MNRQEIEKLSEQIKVEGVGVVDVLGIEHLGPGENPWLATDFFVKCLCRRRGFPFVVKSLGHWTDIKQLFGCS